MSKFGKMVFTLAAQAASLYALKEMVRVGVVQGMKEVENAKKDSPS